MSATGAVPTAPLELRNQLIELAIAANPGLTTNLPGTLIEDIASTDVGALTLIDQARVEAIDRKSTRLNSSHMSESRMPSSA